MFGVVTTMLIIAGKFNHEGSLERIPNSFLSRKSQASTTHCGVSSSSVLASPFLSFGEKR